MSNWVTNDLMGLLAAVPEGTKNPPLTGSNLAELVDMVVEGALSKSQGQQVLGKMIETGRSPRQIAEESGIKQVSDEGALEAAIDAALAANPDVAERLRAGDNKPFGFLMGEVMKATKGQGNPKVVSRLIRRRLG